MGVMFGGGHMAVLNFHFRLRKWVSVSAKGAIKRNVKLHEKGWLQKLLKLDHQDVEGARTDGQISPLTWY